MVGIRGPLAAFALAIASVGNATVTATVDRNKIDFNESLNLTIVSDDVTAEPDISPVEQDFDVLGRRDSSSTTIVNGRMSQTRSWIYALMPKREGELAVPPISVGTETTRPVTISVAKVASTDLGGADVIVSAELDTDETWVQAQVVYTIKILTAVAPRQQRLEEPTITGGEVLFQQLGDDTRYESFVDGRRYSVVERRYAMFPQQSGEFEISEARYSARLWERSRLSGRKVFRSQKLTLSVKPIPPPPAAHPDAAWLPARQIELTERWSPESRDVSAGEPLTRVVRLSAVGLLANQLPEIPRLDGAGLRVYPDQPELETTDSTDGVVGFRTERFAMIAAQQGEYAVPELVLPWWNVTRGRWETARLAAVSLSVGNEMALGETGSEPADDGVADAEPVATTGAGRAWPLISLGLGAGWAATLGFILWTRRNPKRRQSRPAAPPAYRTERRLIREIRSAAGNNEAREASRRLLAWALHKWPDNPPQSLGELASRVPEPVRVAIHGLNAALYGRQGETWRGDDLAGSLAALTELPAKKSVVPAEELAPLTP